MEYRSELKLCQCATGTSTIRTPRQKGRRCGEVGPHRVVLGRPVHIVHSVSQLHLLEELEGELQVLDGAYFPDEVTEHEPWYLIFPFARLNEDSKQTEHGHPVIRGVHLSCKRLR